MRLDSLQTQQQQPPPPRPKPPSSTISNRSDTKATAATRASAARSSVCAPASASRLVLRASSSRPPTSNNNNSSSNGTTTTSSSPTTAARPPLRQKPSNQNVLPLTASRPSITPRAPKMPVSSERPRQPQLSAAAAKGINRTPLTPKVATKASSVVTPLAKRAATSQNPPVLAAHTLPRDDANASTPVVPLGGGPFLSHNITPRSGQRQNRVDSTNTTPTGTPTAERTSDAGEVGRMSTGSAMPSLMFDSTRQSSGESESGDSKFFYASDVKSQAPQSTQQRPASTIAPKSSNFFYANGTSAESKRRTSPPGNLSTPSLNSSLEPASSKFFYANGTPDLAPKGLTSGSNSSNSSARGPQLKRPSTSHSPMVSPTHAQRPVSPMKAASSPNAPTLKTNAVLSSPHNQGRAQMSSPPTLAPATNTSRTRGVTIDAGPKVTRGHTRAGSVPTLELLPAPRLAVTPSGSPEPVSPPISPGLTQPAMTMASLLQAVEDMSEPDEDEDGEPHPEPASPTKSAHSNDTISELVANARRERKVQDLEITNASLEAINRTLERQLRKQTAELRRYRRLSRSGRISLASSRVTSATMTEPPDDLSDLEEEDSYETEEEPDSFEDSEFSGTESTSGPEPPSPNDKAAVRRKRDEKRLQLDLTKHQELLIDSQKMNQSLKRCLSWTEALIKEGQKALEYRVRVSDVQLGGHVLAPLDEEEELSFHEDTMDRDGPTQTGLEPPWTKGPQDRDSGIELPVDGG